jgi:uncharacterized protein YndB with AHSA1/START domain
VSDTQVSVQASQPNPKLTELTRRLGGKWRVKGPEIDGIAEYTSVREGHLLVMNVDFVVNGTAMKVIQHVTYDRDTDTLRAHYMDTLGDQSTYVWALEGRTLRVSLNDENAGTFFAARFNDDDSEYVGTWHYPHDVDDEAAGERITYTRIE